MKAHSLKNFAEILRKGRQPSLTQTEGKDLGPESNSIKPCRSIHLGISQCISRDYLHVSQTSYLKLGSSNIAANHSSRRCLRRHKGQHLKMKANSSPGKAFSTLQLTIITSQYTEMSNFLDHHYGKKLSAVPCHVQVFVSTGHSARSHRGRVCLQCVSIRSSCRPPYRTVF